MAPNLSLFDRLYAEAFAQRTLRAALLISAGYCSVVLFLELLGGYTRWLSFGFWLGHMVVAALFMVLLLARLKFIAGQSLTVSLRLYDSRHLLLFLLVLLTNLVYLTSYFVHYSPSQMTFFAYIEGKYGPPVIREQPFFIFSLASCLSLLTYIMLIWKRLAVVVGSAEEGSNLVKIIMKRWKGILLSSLQIITLSFGLLIVESILLMPPSFILFSWHYESRWQARRAAHSFWELADARMWYHFGWSSLSLLALHHLLEVAIQYYFGECFFVARNSGALCRTLLAGLTGSRPAARSQAILELQRLLTKDPLSRRLLFREFEGEEAVCRKICIILTSELRAYTKHLTPMTADLRRFASLLQEKLAISDTNQGGMDGRGQSNGMLMGRESGVFSPRRRNLLEKIISPLMTEEEPTRARMRTFSSENGTNATLSKKSDSISSKPRLPEVLCIAQRDPPPRSSQESLLSTTHSESRTPTRLGLLQAVASVDGLVNIYPIRLLVAFMLEVRKSWWLYHDESMFWLLEAEAALVVASFEEDIHGQVQFEMDAILDALSDLILALGRFEEEPMVQGHRFVEILFGDDWSPTERRARHLQAIATSALELIMEQFGDTLADMKIEARTLGKLRQLGLVGPV